jgi:hypothetical protein
MTPDPDKDKEFIAEIRRGVMTIIRACVKRYGMSWSDFLPKEENAIIAAIANQQSIPSSPIRRVLYEPIAK